MYLYLDDLKGLFGGELYTTNEAHKYFAKPHSSTSHLEDYLMKLPIGDKIFYINPDTKPAKVNDYRDFKNPENSVKFYLLFLYLCNQRVKLVKHSMIPCLQNTNNQRRKLLLEN